MNVIAKKSKTALWLPLCGIIFSIILFTFTITAKFSYWQIAIILDLMLFTAAFLKIIIEIIHPTDLIKVTDGTLLIYLKGKTISLNISAIEKITYDNCKNGQTISATGHLYLTTNQNKTFRIYNVSNVHNVVLSLRRLKLKCEKIAE